MPTGIKMCHSLEYQNVSLTNVLHICDSTTDSDTYQHLSISAKLLLLDIRCRWNSFLSLCVISSVWTITLQKFLPFRIFNKSSTNFCAIWFNISEYSNMVLSDKKWIFTQVITSQAMCIIAKVCFCFIHGQSLIPSTIAC